jgi:hypothetical protein
MPSIISVTPLGEGSAILRIMEMLSKGWFNVFCIFLYPLVLYLTPHTINALLIYAGS